MMGAPNCSNCLFYFNKSNECRRYPPTVSTVPWEARKDPDVVARLGAENTRVDHYIIGPAAYVPPSWWCGEFQWNDQRGDTEDECQT